MRFATFPLQKTPVGGVRGVSPPNLFLKLFLESVLDVVSIRTQTTMNLPDYSLIVR
jgi:hypothetical protein